MSEMHESDQGGRRIPTLSLRWRLTMSLDESGYSRDQMAEVIGVVPSTISRWTKGHFKRRPSNGDLKEWAMATGVDADWLINGDPGNTGRTFGRKSLSREISGSGTARGNLTPLRLLEAG